MSLASTTWVWNDKEYEFDAYDEENAVLYEKAFKNMGEYEKKMPKDGGHADKIRNYCLMFYNLFDDLFGEGKGEEILGPKKNVNKCHEAYDSFLSFILDQKRNVTDFKTSVASKYSNRQTRRATKRNNS